MNATNSIFNSAITYPAIFLTQPSKKVVKQQSKEVKVKPFFLAPKKHDDKSMIKFLKDNFGIVQDKVLTFKTEFISYNSYVYYNGSKLSLKLTENGNVYLQLSSSKGIFALDCWDIETITKSLNAKKVKFNVSKIKDHGTQWKLF